MINHPELLAEVLNERLEADEDLTLIDCFFKHPETYKEMTDRHRAEINALPLAFAFSGEQLQEILTAWNITEKEAIAGAITPIGHGGYIRTTDKELVSDTFKRIQEERQAAIEADTTGTGFIYQMFRTELNDHGFSYTQEVDDTLTALGFTEADINSNPALKAGLIAAIDKINAGRERDKNNG